MPTFSLLAPPRLALRFAVLAGLLLAMAGPASAQAAPTVSSAAAPALSTAATVPACPALLQHTFPRLQDEKPQSLCQYAGQVLVVVNTASYCGFTGQYGGLEALHAKYKDRGLVVLGFPSNDFAQETGSNQDIAAFCENTFGVKFPMFAKSSVTGKNANAFFKQLAAQGGTAPRWNFYKYVIGRDGRLAASYGSMTGPDDKRFVRQVEQLLAK